MRFLFVALFLLYLLPIFSQENKKVSDYLTDLQIECPPLFSESKSSNQTVPKQYYSSQLPSLYRPASSSNEPTDLYSSKYLAQFTKLAEYLKNHEADAIKRYSAGVFFQDKNMLWGLKSFTGEIIIKPIFLHIIPLEQQTNFIAVSKKRNRYNLYDKEGKSIFVSDYDYIRYISYKDCFLLSNEGKNCVATSKGKIASNPITNFISASDNLKHFSVVRNNKKGVVKSDGTLVIPCTYNKMHFVETNNDATIILAENGDKKLKILSIQDNKEYIIDLPYQDIVHNYVSDNRYLFYHHKGEAKMIDLHTGKDMFCSSKYKIKRILGASDLFHLSTETMHYFFRGNGEMAVPPYKIDFRYDTFHFYNNAIPLGKTNDKGIVRYGLFGNNQKWLIEPIYKKLTANRYTPLIIAQKPDEKSILLNQDGTKVLDFSCSNITTGKFGFNLIRVGNSDKREFYDFNAQKIFEIDLRYDGVIRTSDSFYNATDKETKEKVVLNNKGQIIYRGTSISATGIPDTELSFIFKYLGYKNDKRIVRYIIIDKLGDTIPVLIEGEKIEEFEEYKQIGKSKYYSIKGLKGDTFILNTQTLKAFPLPSGIAIKKYDHFINNFTQLGLLTTFSTTNKSSRNYGLIDTQGNEIFPCIWSDIKISNYNPNYIQFKTKEQSYIYKLNGKRMFTQYNYVETLCNNRFIVSNNGKAGVLDANGKKIIPFEYRRIRLQDFSRLINAIDFSGNTHTFSLDGKEIEIY